MQNPLKKTASRSILRMPRFVERMRDLAYLHGQYDHGVDCARLNHPDDVSCLSKR
jgi:hypothetical protein